MRSKSFSDMECSIARTLDKVGSWWSLLIVRDAMMGATRFKHFEQSLGIAKNTLAARLGELTGAGILERAPGQNGSGFDEYRLTPRGRDLAPVIIALSQWGDKWAPHSEGSSTEVVETVSGRPLSPIWPRRADGAMMALEDIGIRRAARRPPLAWSDE